MGQKIKLQTLIFTKWISQIYILQGGEATQLRFGGIFSNHRMCR